MLSRDIIRDRHTTVSLFVTPMRMRGESSFIFFLFIIDIRTLEHVPGRSINLALSYRGRSALAAVGLEKLVVEHGIPMHARLVHDKKGNIVSKQPYGWRGQVRYMLFLKQSLISLLLIFSISFLRVGGG